MSAGKERMKFGRQIDGESMKREEELHFRFYIVHEAQHLRELHYITYFFVFVQTNKQTRNHNGSDPPCILQRSTEKGTARLLKEKR